MGKVRKCNVRCHTARGKRCKCWCGGAFHSTGGAANRQLLADGVNDVLEQNGFKKGETAYIEQRQLVEV